jgi:hypothetical protein
MVPDDLFIFYIIIKNCSQVRLALYRAPNSPIKLKYTGSCVAYYYSTPTRRRGDFFKVRSLCFSIFKQIFRL